MKKLLCAASAVLILLLSVVSVRAADVSTSSRAYVLYCVENGSVLLSDNAEQKLPMASTTKIMTTLITLEHAAQDNAVVEFTEEMIAEGSSMYLKTGEKVTLYDLAVGMMMQSGNDAANAAAIAIAGSTEAFSKLMNEKAEELGMTDSHFVTPSGLDDERHYSTARDMALLMAAALQNEMFAEITAQSSMTVDFIFPEGKCVTYPNHNRLLRMYDSCIGGKTGYTDQAGRCLVSAARRDGMTLIAVTLDDRDDWHDHMALYDYGFSSYTAYMPQLPDSIGVVGGEQDRAALYAGDSLPFIIPREEDKQVDAEVCLSVFAYAPIKKDEAAGRIILTLDGEIVGEKPIFYAESVDYNSTKRHFIQYIKDLFNWHS